jgi:hypothetical protein
MIYGFSALLFILGLATGIPAIPQLLRMRKIKENSAATHGLVQLQSTPNGGLMTSVLGKVNHPQFLYRTPDNKEYTIEVVDSSTFKFYRYKSGESVEIVYDKSSPWLAYVKREWDIAFRDLWMAGGELLVSIILWNVGVAFKLPF